MWRSPRPRRPRRAALLPRNPYRALCLRSPREVPDPPTARSTPAASKKKVGGRYENGFVGSTYSYIDGKRLTFGLSEKAANDQSVWRTTDKSPPTPAREAIANARRKLLEVFPAKRTWTLSQVVLDPVDFTLDAPDGIELWQYRITFERHREPPNPHFHDVDGKVTMVVLMDGTVVDPIVEPNKEDSPPP
jgi:hypothetical protein